MSDKRSDTGSIYRVISSVQVLQGTVLWSLPSSLFQLSPGGLILASG
jgi:hypothetical protein